MNIDDRLEAFAQSVELLYLSSKDSNKRMHEFGQRMDQLRQSVAELVANSDRLWMLYTSQDRNLALHERRSHEHDNRACTTSTEGSRRMARVALSTS